MLEESTWTPHIFTSEQQFKLNQYHDSVFWIRVRFLLDFKIRPKEIRKFFIKHNKSFRWHLGDYEKHNFFHFEGLSEDKL